LGDKARAKTQCEYALESASGQNNNGIRCSGRSENIGCGIADCETGAAPAFSPGQHCLLISMSASQYNGYMTKKPMLIFSIDPALLEQVDAFRFKHRFPARSGAIKFLLACALKFNPKPEAADLQREEWRSRRPKAKSKGR
jgi:hypothetical protein